MQIDLSEKQMSLLIDLVCDLACEPAIFYKDGKDLVLNLFEICKPHMQKCDRENAQEEIETNVELWKKTNGKMQEI